MSQGGYVTLVGFVAQDPVQRETKNGVMVTDLRVGATPRVQDRVTNQWRDGDYLVLRRQLLAQAG